MWRFQPTLPARGATFLSTAQYLYYRNFNPRSPHGERLFADNGRQIVKHFNPRSPHGERPQSRFCSWKFVNGFQPTLPARGATRSYKGFSHDERISTHAPRTGSDVLLLSHWKCCLRFQPTLPARGATRLYNTTFRCYCISTHAPRTGSDEHTCLL